MESGLVPGKVVVVESAAVVTSLKVFQDGKKFAPLASSTFDGQNVGSH